MNTPIIATSTGSNYEPCPQGNHVGRCYQMIHLGTLNYQYKGEVLTANKVRITFELPNELHTFNEEKGPQPYSLSKEFTLSMHEKSNLRKMLEGWRGKAFSESEVKNFDITKLIGVPCMINVIHTEKDGKTYAGISSISAMPKGFTCPEQVNTTVVFSVNAFDWEIFETLPDFIKEKIRTSKEYQAMAKPNVQPAQVFQGKVQVKDTAPIEPPQALFAEPEPTNADGLHF